jgi:hypothetical protein
MESKWFALSDDRYEGPLRLDEIRSRAAEGGVSDAGVQVWCEGMDSWVGLDRLMDAEPDVAYALAPAVAPSGSPSSPFSKKPPLPPKRPAPASSLQPPVISASRARPQPASEGSAIQRSLARGRTPAAGGRLFRVAAVSTRALRIAVAVFSIAAALGSGAWSLQKYRERFAFPALSGQESVLAPSALERLRVEWRAGRFGLELTRQDPWAPRLIALSRVAREGKWQGIEVKIEGETGTLVDARSYSERLMIELQDGVAISRPLRASEGKPLPRGYYKISVLAGEETLVSSRYLIAGPDEQDYLRALKGYQQKTAEQRQLERQELGDALTALREQLEQSVSAFAKAQAAAKAGLRRGQIWRAKTLRWQEMAGELERLYAQWSTEPLHSNLVERVLYDRLIQHGRELRRLHAAMDEWANDATSYGSAFEAQALARAQELRASLVSIQRVLAEST